MIKKYILLIFLTPLLSYSQNKSTQGEWSDPIPFGIVPVAVANLPNGNLITWSSQFRDTFILEGDGTTFTQLFDPITSQTIGPAFVSNTDHDMFCPGINNLADGRILSAGGTSSEKTSIYDWRTNEWSVADQMNIPRGYQGNVTLRDGSVFTLGGSWSGGNYGNRDAEIYSPLTGWLRLPNIQGEDIYTTNDLNSDIQGQYRVDNHLWLWAAPNGKLFHAGPSEMMHWIDVDAVGGNIIEAGIRQDLSAGETDAYSMKGNTVMFDIGKILKTGGAPTYGDDYIPELQARNNSFVIDINGSGNTPTPTVTFTGNMNNHRTMHNSTVLPNGEVLVTGGLTDAAVFTDIGAVLGAEIFNPNTTGNNWRTVAEMSIPRTYHSVAILMVDGRVFVGGGGLCDSSPGCEDHMDAEIYSPPYLFNPDNSLATRPVISAGPDSADYETAINIEATSGIQEFSLIRFSAATHATNNEQRRIPVEFVDNGNNYDIQIPERNLLPPGYYMLFALDSNGVPSIAHTIQIGDEIPLTNNSNLVLDMQFDETSGINATDSSQYSNNGTIVQRDNDGDIETPNQFSWSEGLIGGALEFDGLEFNSNSLLEIDYSEELASTANSITLSAWVYRNSNSVIPEPEASGKVANVGIFSHDYPSMFFGFHNTLYKWAFIADSPLDCYAGYAPLDTWVHLAATYDGNVAKLYANGIEVCSREMSGPIDFLNDGTELSSFTASGFYEDGGRPLPAVPYGNTSGITDEISGKMDLLKVYNKVLEPAEIQALYLEGLNTNNPEITNCEGNYLTAEYRIGPNGQWLESNNIIAPQGAEVYIRPKDYSGEYFVTTSQYDGPTYSNTNNPTRFTVDNAYQIDTFVAIIPNFPPWDNPDRNNGFVDSSNEGQFVMTTPSGCPTTVYFSLVNTNNDECPAYLPNDDPTIFITSGSLNALLDEAIGTNIETNYSECALELRNDVIDSEQTNRERFAHFSSSIKIADYGIQVGDEIYIEIDGKGNNSPAVEVYRNNDPTIDQPLLSAGFPVDWLTRSGTFIVPPNTQTLDIWMYSNYGSTSPGRAYFDNLKLINLTATGGNYPPTSEFTASPLTGVAPLTVNFNANDSADEDGTVNQYVWKFGDNTTSNDKNPEHLYSTPGTYLVSLTVFDNGGLRDEKTTYITVLDSSNESPVAVATANIFSGNAPLEVDFTSNGSTDDNAIVSYAWDFGDGGTATTANPQYTFTSAGGYDVSLTVTDAQGSFDTETISIDVNGVPTAVATANILSGNAPLEIDFTGSDSTDDGTITYAWDFGDGGTATTADPQYTFNTAGSYDVLLTVTDAQGALDTETITINVNGIPTAVATANVLSGNTPLVVDFVGSNSTDDGIITYAWDFGDGGAATTADPQYTFNTAGSYDVLLTVTDAQGALDTETITINVNRAPTAVATANVFSGNPPLVVDFVGSNSTDDGIITYAWDFGEGGTATTADPQYTFNTIGEFTVTLEVADDEGATSSDTITISVNDLPNQPPVAIISANPLSGNAPLVVDFVGSNSTDDNQVVTYAWDFGEGGTATTADPQYTFNTIGEFIVTLVVTDDEGATSSDAITISVNELPNQPPVAIISANPLSGNAPLVVDFVGSDSTDDNQVVTYAWDFGDGGTATTANPQYTFNTIGEFIVTLVVTDEEGATSSDTITISVNELPNQPPVAIISANPLSGNAPLVVDFVGSDSTDDNQVVTYAWDFGDGGTATTADPQYTFNTIGEFIVTLVVTDDEGATASDTIAISLIIENEPLTESSIEDIIIYPNPVRNETLKIELSKFMGDGINIGFYDIYGKLVFQQIIPTNHRELYEIDLSLLSNGIYLMELIKNKDNTSIIKKVVKIE